MLDVVSGMNAVTIYAGNAGDRNERGMLGAIDLGTAIAERYSLPMHIVGQQVEPAGGGWATQLAAATPNMRLLAQQVGRCLGAGRGIVLTQGRCAASIATLPVIADHSPDSAIVWFDAHGDCNAPAEGNAMSYLGGMVLTGAAGLWETGFGKSLDLGNVILVGARDLDPPERARIASGQIELVPAGERLADRLMHAITGRPVYVHFDCDVMNAGLLATEYQVPGGLVWSELREVFEALSACAILGIEIAEYEATWPDGQPNSSSELLSALHPVMEKLCTCDLPGSSL